MYDNIREIKIENNNMIESIDHNFVNAFMFAELGAMGDAGEIKYYCKDNDAITIYYGNRTDFGIKHEIIEKLHDKLLNRDNQFSDSDWFYFSLGYGNHLYLRMWYQDAFVKQYESAEEHIYLCYDKIVKSVLEVS